jgi:hypothetical protein
MNHIAALHQITMAKCDAEVQLDLPMTFIVYGNDPATPQPADQKTFSLRIFLTALTR